MAYIMELNCRCTKCKGPLGISTRLMAECRIQEEFPDGDISSADADLLLKQDAEPFVKFPLVLDPVTMTLYFLLWCPTCRETTRTGITVNEILELAVSAQSEN